MELIDLSQEIYQGMPVFPGHLGTVSWDLDSHEETAKRYEGDYSYTSKGLMLSEHGPTHVDSISHFDPRPGAPSIDRMPLSSFYGPAVCLDLAAKTAREYIEITDLEAALARSAVPLEPGDIVLVRTGVAELFGGTPEYTTEYPGMSEAACRWLVEAGARAFGVDAPSPDNPLSRTYPCHMICRELGITHYENLGNLAAVLDRRFTFVGLPLKIRGGTGSPVRAIAIVS